MTPRASRQASLALWPARDWRRWTAACELDGADAMGRGQIRGPGGSLPVGLPGRIFTEVPAVAPIAPQPAPTVEPPRASRTTVRGAPAVPLPALPGRRRGLR